MWPKIKNNARIIQVRIWNHNSKFTFLNEIILFSSNSTVSSVEILQMLRSIEFPLQFIGLDDHNFGIFRILLFVSVVVLTSTFKNKNSLRTS